MKSTVTPTISSNLNTEEIARYSRHLLLPEFGLKGQVSLKKSRILLVGAGGLGSPCILYLAAAGVGTIGLIDFDEVDTSNLQRQIIHGMSDVGRKKIDSAAESIKEINPNIIVEKFDVRLDKENAINIISKFDLVLDGTDNFPTRYLVNDACVIAKKPYVWGSIFRFEGQVSVFWEQAPNGMGINYRDLYPEPPPPEHAPSCSEGGVLGVLCAAVGAIMATEAIKLIAGIGESLIGKLLVYDALEMNYKKFPIHKKEDRFAPEALGDYDYFCGIDTEIENKIIPSISVHELKNQLNENSPPTLIDVRESTELDIVKLDYSLNFPKSNFNIDKLPNGINKESSLVIMCKSGGRSSDVVQKFIENGFTNVKNLEGGILNWIKEIEPELPAY
ncbi:MAG: molybdopterin-synthase adenylyltransferase MoeB [Cellvibrionaceae bacterium]